MTAFALAIYITLIFIRPMEWWEPVLGFQLVSAAAMGTLLTGFPRLLSDWRWYWKNVPEIRAAIFLLIGVACSQAATLWLQGIWNVFAEFGKVIFLYVFLVLVSAHKQSSFRILLWTVLFCTGWMALHGVIMGTNALLVGADAHGFGPAVPRWRPSHTSIGTGVYQIVAYGIFDDPNDLCLVFVISLPLLLAEYSAYKNPVTRFGALALIPLNLYAAYFTNSRGGLVGLFGMAAAYIIGRLKGFKRWFAIAITIGLITVGAPARGSELGIVDKDRLVCWGDGLDAFRLHPFFGIGYGNFATLTHNLAAHNAYVNALTELGMIGYIPFMLLLFLTATHLRRASLLKTRVSKRDQAYLVGLYSATIGYLTAIYFLSRTYSHVLYILLALGIGKVAMICSDEEIYQEVFVRHKRQDLRRGLYFAFGTIPFIWLTIRLARSMG